MKILAFADLHESMAVLAKIEQKIKKNDIDLVICLGDFAIFDHATRKFIGHISKLHNKIILLYGNHEDEDEVRDACRQYKNITFLHKTSCEFGDFTFFGYGGGGFAMRDSEFVRSITVFLKDFVKKKRPLILLTHGPAHNTKLDALWGGHVGNIDYKEFIDAVKPCVYMCGHLHENFRVHYVEKGTLFINPGPEGMIIDLVSKDK